MPFVKTVVLVLTSHPLVTQVDQVLACRVRLVMTLLRERAVAAMLMSVPITSITVQAMQPVPTKRVVSRVSAIVVTGEQIMA